MGRRDTGVLIRIRYLPCFYDHIKMDSTVMQNWKEPAKLKLKLKKGKENLIEGFFSKLATWSGLHGRKYLLGVSEQSRMSVEGQQTVEIPAWNDETSKSGRSRGEWLGDGDQESGDPGCWFRMQDLSVPSPVDPRTLGLLELFSAGLTMLPLNHNNDLYLLCACSGPGMRLRKTHFITKKTETRSSWVTCPTPHS